MIYCEFLLSMIIGSYRSRKNWTGLGKERNIVGMVDSFTNHDRPPPPITNERQDDLPEIEIPPPPDAVEGVGKASFTRSLPLSRSLPPRRREGTRSSSAQELLLPRRRRRFRTKVLLFSVIGFGLGILVGVGFLLG